MPELQPEEFRIVESPAGHSTAGAGNHAPATSRRRCPVGHPSRAMAPVHPADTRLTENEAFAIDDGEGIGGVRGPLVATSRYPPLGSLDEINRLAGLATHERTGEGGDLQELRRPRSRSPPRSGGHINLPSTHLEIPSQRL